MTWVTGAVVATRAWVVAATVWAPGAAAARVRYRRNRGGSGLAHWHRDGERPGHLRRRHHDGFGSRNRLGRLGHRRGSGAEVRAAAVVVAATAWATGVAAAARVWVTGARVAATACGTGIAAVGRV